MSDAKKLKKSSKKSKKDSSVRKAETEVSGKPEVVEAPEKAPESPSLSNDDGEDPKKGKKRNLDLEELEINVDLPEPLSKKQKRQLKKGKIDENKKRIKSEEELAKEKEEEANKPGQFGVWIGNLSFNTDEETIKRFIVGLSRDFEVPIPFNAITRINMPQKGGKSKGFAYVDFSEEKYVTSCIELSEKNLDGRNLLIKNAKSFEGRPTKQQKDAMSKNPPHNVLFIGNLSWDTTEEQLQMQFQHCGDIKKIRMATFQDSGKCKGFAFIDFKEIDGATAALKDKSCYKLHGRPLELQYGEDRSKKRYGVKKGQEEEVNTNAEVNQDAKPIQEISHTERTEHTPRSDKPKREFKKDNYSEKNRRPNPGLALANAQRASTAIVASKGKKVTFD